MPKLILLLLLISCIKNDLNCQISADNYSYFDKYLKNYNICQDPKNDSLIRLRFEKGDLETKYCFIPTYIGVGTNKSIYIGEPRCLFITDPAKVYEVVFLKNRPGPEGAMSYSKFPIKGVMIIKDEVIEFGVPFDRPLPAPNAYLKCAEVLDLTADDSYCEVFKEMGLYSFHQF